MTSYERLKRSVWKTEDLTQHMEIRQFALRARELIPTHL